MIQTLIDGGPVMVPIGLASLVGLSVFLERIWALRASRVVPRAFVVELGDLIKQRRFDDATMLCRKVDCSASRVLEVALEVRDQPRPLIKERVEEVGRREAAELERFIPVLGVVSSVSPLLGLLGTVGGMILTFQAIESQGALGNISALAGGISQALITTFAGLTVAIPALIANRYLLAKVDGLLLDVEEATLMMLDLLVSRQGEES